MKEEEALGITVVLLLFVAPFMVGVAALLVALAEARRTVAAEEAGGRSSSHHPAAPPLRPGDDGICAICLDPRHFPASTMCGHRFCTHCIMEHWERGRSNGAEALSCPCCRQTVTLLIPEFGDANANAAAAAGGDDAIGARAAAQARLSEYNALHGTEAAGSWGELLRSAPLLLRRLWRRLVRRPVATSFRIILLLVQLRRILPFLGGILYLLSPIDLIPEAFFGAIGLIDDAVVFFACCIMLAGLTRVELVQEARRAR